MDDIEVKKVCNWKTPSNVTEIHKLLGFTGYYCYFIKDYLKIARPLLQLTHLTTPWSWKQEEQTAFETLRESHDQQTSTPTTRFHQTILPTHRCISIWCGSHTLTRGMINQPKHHPKTQITPSHLLFCCVHQNRMQL
jgi:hypothetical protein